ncbi:hypothetical protein ACFL1X_01655 [Candidatus Hydrogenedentota bacterium]
MFSGIVSTLALTMALAIPAGITPEVRTRLDKKVSVEFHNVDVRLIVDYLVEQTGISVVIDPRPFEERLVKDGLGAFLVGDLVAKNKPVGEVLSTALISVGLTWKIDDSFIWISDSERIRYETSELLVTRVYIFKQNLTRDQLKFIESSIDEVRDKTGAAVSKFLPNDDENMVIIKSAPSRLARFEELYARILKPATGEPMMTDRETQRQLREKVEQLSMRVAALEDMVRALMPAPEK